jgi:hypothetical protein
MRIALIAMFLLLNLSVYAGEQPPFKNVVGIESGMFHRGLIGVSYHRLNENRDRLLTGIGGGAGIGGVPFGGGINQFYFVTGFTGLGFKIDGDPFYICAGTDIRYLDFNDAESDEENNYYRKHYSGFGFVPCFTLAFEQQTIMVQMRVSPWTIPINSELPPEHGGAGITVGKVF